MFSFVVFMLRFFLRISGYRIFHAIEFLLHLIPPHPTHYITQSQTSQSTPHLSSDLTSPQPDHHGIHGQEEDGGGGGDISSHSALGVSYMRPEAHQVVVHEHQVRRVRGLSAHLSRDRVRHPDASRAVPRPLQQGPALRHLRTALQRGGLLPQVRYTAGVRHRRVQGPRSLDRRNLHPSVLNALGHAYLLRAQRGAGRRRVSLVQGQRTLHSGGMQPPYGGGAPSVRRAPQGGTALRVRMRDERNGPSGHVLHGMRRVLEVRHQGVQGPHWRVQVLQDVPQRALNLLGMSGGGRMCTVCRVEDK